MVRFLGHRPTFGGSTPAFLYTFGRRQPFHNPLTSAKDACTPLFSKRMVCSAIVLHMAPSIMMMSLFLITCCFAVAGNRATRRLRGGLLLAQARGLGSCLRLLADSTWNGGQMMLYKDVYKICLVRVVHPCSAEEPCLGGPSMASRFV